ncbi:ABC transporter ATP-binding protein [Patescibacteria group bacterium]|nr:MAG: ABC transporter ATP-binding protein [Patescibacteria group bacterium]
MSSNTQVVNVAHLTKHYKSFAAIDDVSFSINKGEVVGFVGLNGAGKSTTINIMLGFLHGTNGSVTIFDQMVTPQTAHKTHQKIGFASGDMTLFSNLTGKQYFKFIAGRFGVHDNSRLKQLSDLFMPDVDKKIGDLSRGNKQKIALIAAFMTSPELVILDEPSSGLDPLMQQNFIDLIREETTKGTTIFMSSHYLTEVIDVCSRVVLIREGKIVKDIPASELVTDGGKKVRLVSKNIVAPPRTAELIEKKEIEDGYELLFVYKAKPTQLQQWLSGVVGLIDVSITDHDLKAAFDDLYELETGEHA